MIKPSILILLLAVLSASSSGCAAIFMGGGSFKEVPITSNVNGTRIEIDGLTIGQTPAVAVLRRSRSHVISAEANGQRRETVVGSNIGPAGFGLIFIDFIFFGLIGVVVDIISDSGYSLDQEYVNFIFVERIINKGKATPPPKAGEPQRRNIFLDSGKIGLAENFDLIAVDTGAYIIPETAVSYVEYEEASSAGAPWRRSDHIPAGSGKKSDGSLNGLIKGKYYIRRDIEVGFNGFTYPAMKVAKITVP